MPHLRVVILGLAAIASAGAVAGCPGRSTPIAPIGNTAGPDADRPAAVAGRVDGALWTCQIGDYDPQPCKLSQAGAGWTLAKLLGSQRFAGAFTWTDPDTVEFHGRYFCPWGACDEAMLVTFARADAAFVTDFGGDMISVRYDATLAREWAGAGYGGLTGDER